MRHFGVNQLSRRPMALSIALLSLLLLLPACGRSMPAAEVEMTPAAGGMPAPADDAPGPAPVAVEEEADEAAAPVLTAGQRVVLIAPTGAPLQADAGGDMVLNVLTVGDPLTILEPSGDYADYPVQAEDGAWYRVRAGDGLVGWVEAAALAAAIE